LLMDLRHAFKMAVAYTDLSRLELEEQKKQARNHISAHMKVALMIAEFTLYERLFGLWHMFHLPFFFMLIIVIVVHVIAVHLF
jgi:hypothetical protein